MLIRHATAIAALSVEYAARVRARCSRGVRRLGRFTGRGIALRLCARVPALHIKSAVPAAAQHRTATASCARWSLPRTGNELHFALHMCPARSLGTTASRPPACFPPACLLVQPLRSLPAAPSPRSSLLPRALLPRHPSPAPSPVLALPSGGNYVAEDPGGGKTALTKRRAWGGEPAARRAQGGPATNTRSSGGGGCCAGRWWRLKQRG